MPQAMENNFHRETTMEEEQQRFELPPGFRFHPTDEELITHYLSQKVLDSCFCARAIGEADLNKCEPWDLPWMAKMGEKEMYFFCVRDRKYPTGQRTNRATGAGYWKATGKDKEIYKAKALIGMKKTLVFYRGRAPSGEKTNWVMHEYRLENEHSVHNPPPQKAMNDWAICRIFQKSNCGKKMSISGLVRFSTYGNDMPSLMDSSPNNNNNNNSDSKPVLLGESSHATTTCFSSDPNQSGEDQMTQDENNNNNIADSYDETIMLASSCYSPKPFDVSPASWTFPKPAPIVSHQSPLQVGNSHCSDYFDADMASVMMYNNEMFQRSFGNQEYSSPSVGHVYTGSGLWGF